MAAPPLASALDSPAALAGLIGVVVVLMMFDLRLFARGRDPSFREGLVARIPLRRIADPDDLVGAALFFCSDASAFVTGQVLTLDGGLTATQ